MNERIKKLAVQSYSTAFEKCKAVEYRVKDVDNVFAAFSVQEMYRLSVKECIQKLIDNGYDDAAKCLTEEMTDA
jgi:hypothetical protein